MWFESFTAAALAVFGACASSYCCVCIALGCNVCEEWRRFTRNTKRDE